MFSSKLVGLMSLAVARPARGCVIFVLFVLLAACDDHDKGDNAVPVIPIPPEETVTPAAEARVLALSRQGKVASLQITDPWEILATNNLESVISSARCRAGLCVVVHPAPVNAISVLDASTLELIRRINLEADSDPRDAVFTHDDTLVIGFYERDALIELDLGSDISRHIDLSALADQDGLPEVLMMTACGKQLYVQLQRLDHRSGLPSDAGPILVAIDTWNADAMHILPLQQTPALDMYVDCAQRTLIVMEPKAIVEGGGNVQYINLNTGVIRNFLSEDEFANGGVVPISNGVYWVNQHTDTGPGPSSHLTLVGAGESDVFNVFAVENVDNIALDLPSDQLFYPNPCGTIDPECDDGLKVFNAHTGVSPGGSLQLGFSPIEVVISR